MISLNSLKHRPNVPFADAPTELSKQLSKTYNTPKMYIAVMFVNASGT